ncbi:hypothetical protein CP8484711_1680, partial [Chlamydia psittaci 84-8471/1]
THQDNDISDKHNQAHK